MYACSVEDHLSDPLFDQGVTGLVSICLNKGSTAVKASVALGACTGSTIAFEVLSLPTMFTGNCRYGGPFLRPFTKISEQTQLSH